MIRVNGIPNLLTGSVSFVVGVAEVLYCSPAGYGGSELRVTVPSQQLDFVGRHGDRDGGSRMSYNMSGS